MATRTISNTGGNWNSTATWVEGVVPVLGDAVVATATSGQLTINITTAACTSINFTNYTNTFTISSGQTLTVSGSVTFVAAMTVAGTGTLVVNATATLTSAGKTLTGNLTLAGTSQTYTLADNWTVSGNLLLSGTTLITVNGLFNLNIAGNLTVTTNTSGTTTIVLNGTGTWSSAGVLTNNTTINTTGTITLSGTVRYQSGVLTYTAGTVVTTGSTLLCANTTTFNTNGSSSPSATTTSSTGINFNNVTLQTAGTITNNSNLTVIGTLTINTGNPTINGSTLYLNGSLTTTTSPTGTALFLLQGTGTWSSTVASAAGSVRNNLTINTAGTITFGTNVYYNTGTFTYTAGTVVTAGSTFATTPISAGANGTYNTNGINFNNVVLGGNTTLTLTSNMTVNGLLTLGGASGTTINGSGGTRTVIASNGITITGTTAGTANMRLTGGTLSNTAGILQSNLEFAGNSVVSGTINYNTGTLLYTSGTITTSGSTLSIATSSTTLNTGGITWNNITFTPPSTPLQTITIPSNLTIGGNLTMSGDMAGTSIVSTGGTLSISGDLIMNPISANGTTLTIPNNITVVNLSSIGAAGAGLNGFSVNVTGNFTTTRAIGGTTDINLIGTGTWSGSGAVIANLTFNSPSGTITLSGNLNYTTNSALITKTITYTAGTIITTGSTLTLNNSNSSFTSIRLNTNTMVWNNINIPGINQIGATHTITLLSDLYLSGTLYTIYPGPNGSNCAFSGAFTVYTGGLRVDFTLSGSPIVLNGTGTWQATYNLFSNLTINTSGTITISGIVYYTTGILTYTAGTVITTNSTLTLTNNLTLNTNGIDWNNVTFSTSVVSCITTLLSDFNILGTTTFSAVGSVGLTFTAGTNRFNPTGPVVFSISTSGHAFGVTLSNNITIASLTYTTAFSNNTATFNSQTVNILGNLSVNGPGICVGTSTLVLAGIGTWSHSSTGTIRNNLIINTGGTITISGNIYYNTGTLTYTKGNVNAKNATLNINIASTLINCHRIAFGIVTITSGIIVTMNEFFSGTPAYKTIVQPSSTTNYTITFQDNFEKFARNVKISRATMSIPGQLSVITDKGNNGNNIGIKFYPNQIPNGLAKNNPSVQPQTTYLPGGLVTDPCLV